MSGLRKYTIWVGSKLLEKLRQVSKRTRIPASVLAREGLEYIVRKYRKKS